MLRRLLLFLPMATCLAADASGEVWELLSHAASALSERNAQAFLAAFDPAMPGYEKLRSDISALLSAAEVQSTIDLESDEGDEANRAVELDWLLRIRPEQEATSSIRRQQRVKCRFRKTGKTWRIVAFEPLELFAPPGQ